MNRYMRAYETHRDRAEIAEKLFEHFCGRRMPRVPGMCTVIRLAWRLECGKSIVEAAGAEYRYRWHLALIPSPRNAELFGVPHTLGL